MSARQQNSRYQLDSDEHAAYRTRSLAVVSVTRCRCGEKFHGTIGEGVVWHAAHRKAVHPAGGDRGQRARQAAAKAAPVSYWNSRGQGYEA